MGILIDLSKRNNMAFTGILECPRCRWEPHYNAKKQVWKEIGRQTPTRIRYRCAHCNQSLIYDISK